MASITDQGQLQGTLRIYASEHFNGYATSAKQLHQFLFPLEYSDKSFSQWIVKRIAYYGFDEDYDFVTKTHPEKGIIDASLSLDMAKELTRIERTEQGRKARYYLVNLGRLQMAQAAEYSHLDDECGVRKAFLKEGFSERDALFDKKVTQLNQLAQSIQVGEEIVVLQTLDLINLVKAVRQYQYIADLYVTPDHDLNPIWANEIIEKIKQSTGKALLDKKS